MPNQASPVSMGIRWVVAGTFALVGFRLWLFLHCMESFSSRDDAWMVAYASGLADGSFIDHMAKLVEWSLREFSGGTRVNVVTLAWVARVVEPTYGMVKTASALVGGATFLATAWALRRRVSPATLVWFWVLCLVPPFRSLVVSAQFTGNHQELPLFMMLAMGCAFRFADAWDAEDSISARRWGLAWGFITGLGIYYCQTYWLWLAVQGSFFVLQWWGASASKWKSVLLSFVPGFLPGVLLCLLAYYPDHLGSIFFPYSGASEFPSHGTDSAWTRFEHAMEMSVIGLPGEMNLGTAISGSFLWLPAAIFVLRRDSRGIQLAAVTWAGFIVGLCVLSAWMGNPLPRHLAPLVPGFLLLQAMILGRLSSARGVVTRVWLVVLAVIVIVPRARDIATLLPGSYSLDAAWNFPAHRLEEMDVAGLSRPGLEAVDPLLADLDRLYSNPSERRAMYHGIGEVFWRSAGVDVEGSLPYRFLSGSDWREARDVPPTANRWFHSTRYAYLMQDPNVQESWAGEAAVETAYYAGLTLALSTLRTAGVLEFPDLVCEPCERALDGLKIYLEGDDVVQFIEDRLCSGPSPTSWMASPPVP